ncbi:HAMP domain-containing histidine kinase [Allorhizobium sp. BGMRC 0089]|uniref:sensor histidine kinase n=1 Tax=Allorhizobium sonneratiae TaxID=2934936 RepID=UPI0020347095|nr:HAMP domain-containing sensor histidine kinase [Allorhizobium sonneratiae]MCM2293195.1 HAMP domain-containing histidine kinase [Allorhizobium sonneratiae]
MTSNSMTRHLLLWIVTALTLLWLAAACVGAWIMHDEFGEIFDSSLQETTERLLPLVVDDAKKLDPDDSPVQMETPEDLQSDGHLIYQVRDASGRVLMHSERYGSTPLPAPLIPGFWQNDYYRVYTAATADRSLFVQGADMMAHRRKSTYKAVLTMIIPLLGLIPLSLWAAYLIIRSMLQPVETLQRAIGEKDGGNLVPIMLSGLPKELLPIGRSVNLLLERLRSALDAERDFTSNSAHELRTPIAGALAQIQLLIQSLNQPKLKERAQLVETSLLRLTALAEKLLQLSRAEAGIGQTDQAHDLVPLLDMLVEEFRRNRPDRDRIIYRHSHEFELLRPINPDAFAIAIRNMLENAARHGSADAPIVVTINAEGAISVTNGGPVLSQEDLQFIRKRFHRKNANAPGTGLGLSIIERLTEQMNGRFVMISPASDRSDGVECRLLLP